MSIALTTGFPFFYPYFDDLIILLMKSLHTIQTFQHQCLVCYLVKHADRRSTIDDV